MKYIHQFLVISLLAGLVSCEKNINVGAPDFDVKVEKVTYNVGDTIRFDFSGQADNITFYSGLPGADYRFKDRTQVEGGVPRARITTQYGGGGNQLESLRVMVSSDLEELTVDGVANATWTDITEHVDIAIDPTVVESENIDLSPWVDESTSFFIAFKFLGEDDPVTNPGNWIIRGLDAGTLLPNGDEIPVVSLGNADWTIVDVLNPNTIWTIRGNPIVDVVIIGGGPNAPASEDWLISKPLYFTKVPPDRGLPIQNLGTNSLTEYSFVYSTPGTYHVAFVASNTSVDDFKAVVREFEITILPSP